eukprot:3230815-Rhodomonas_salina.2
MLLRTPYAVFGTDLAYAATVGHGREHTRHQVCSYPMLLPYTPTPCPRMVLRASYAISGTDIAYAPTKHPQLTWRMLLRACYATCGYDATRRMEKAVERKERKKEKVCSFAVCGTGVRYAPTPLLCGVRYIARLCCYAISGY